MAFFLRFRPVVVFFALGVVVAACGGADDAVLEENRLLRQQIEELEQELEGLRGQLEEAVFVTFTSEGTLVENLSMAFGELLGRHHPPEAEAPFVAHFHDLESQGFIADPYLEAVAWMRVEYQEEVELAERRRAERAFMEAIAGS